MKTTFAGIVLWALLAFISTAQAEAPFSIEVESRPITNFAIGSSQTRFGELEFVGGFEMWAREPVFGQISALRFLSPGNEFIGVADHGYWLAGKIRRDAEGMPAGIADFHMQRMVDAQGIALAGKTMSDAEGLDIYGSVATIAFEREARLCEYELKPESSLRIDMAGPVDCIDFVIPQAELRQNKGLETVARAPASSNLAGARIVIAERSIDKKGDIFAAIVEGPQKGVFKVRRSNDYDVTDGVFLPNGDLVLLERRFSLVTGVGMRLRRIAGDTIRPGALVDGEVLMEADLRQHIDNMEGIDVWQHDDGTTMLSLISDNNQSFLQRTLYLEFRLLR